MEVPLETPAQRGAGRTRVRPQREADWTQVERIEPGQVITQEEEEEEEEEEEVNMRAGSEEV